MKRTLTASIASATMLVASFSAAHGMDAQIDEARFGGVALDIVLENKQSYYKYNLPGVNAEVLFAPFDFELEELQQEVAIAVLQVQNV